MKGKGFYGTMHRSFDLLSSTARPPIKKTQGNKPRLHVHTYKHTFAFHYISLPKTHTLTHCDSLTWQWKINLGRLCTLNIGSCLNFWFGS